MQALALILHTCTNLINFSLQCQTVELLIEIGAKFLNTIIFYEVSKRLKHVSNSFEAAIRLYGYTSITCIHRASTLNFIAIARVCTSHCTQLYLHAILVANKSGIVFIGGKKIK